MLNAECRLLIADWLIFELLEAGSWELDAD
jgi:hypothetical protein